MVKTKENKLFGTVKEQKVVVLRYPYNQTRKSYSLGYEFANFHENLETMSDGNSLWEETGGDAKIQMEAVSTCSAPEISNGQVFFDPGDPDFS
mgnify:CR=1 FL=1